MFGALGVLDEDVEDGLEDSDRVINTEVGAFTGRLLANQYMNKPLDEVHLMARFVRQWLELPRERSGERRVVDLQQAFADATGVALDDLLVVTAALWARSLMNNVSSRTALLVTDGSFDGGKADNAATLGTRVAHPDEFAVLLDHLQPAVSKSAVGAPLPRLGAASAAAVASSTVVVAEGRTRPAAHVGQSPAAVRAWARANGYEVGERGRLPVEVTEAYRRAHTGASSH